MNKILVIGDVHGKTDKYQEILRQHTTIDMSICVGDFGFFSQHMWHLQNVDSHKHKILFGNHDDTTFLHNAHSLGNCSLLFDKVMTVRGAFSIDRQHRWTGISWWSDEELSFTEAEKAFDMYVKHQPEIMITHDCPQIIRQTFFNISKTSVTSNLLNEMLAVHKPKKWIFGHHHKNLNIDYDGCNFICLEECSTYLLTC